MLMARWPLLLRWPSTIQAGRDMVLANPEDGRHVGAEAGQAADLRGRARQAIRGVVVGAVSDHCVTPEIKRYAGLTGKGLPPSP